MITLTDQKGILSAPERETKRLVLTHLFSLCLKQVRVNGNEYRPTFASLNKKHAKATAATAALQAMGLVPKESMVNTTMFRSASHRQILFFILTLFQIILLCTKMVFALSCCKYIGNSHVVKTCTDTFRFFFCTIKMYLNHTQFLVCLYCLHQ